MNSSRIKQESYINSYTDLNIKKKTSKSEEKINFHKIQNNNYKKINISKEFIREKKSIINRFKKDPDNLFNFSEDTSFINSKLRKSSLSKSKISFQSKSENFIFFEETENINNKKINSVFNQTISSSQDNEEKFDTDSNKLKGKKNVKILDSKTRNNSYSYNFSNKNFISSVKDKNFTLINSARNKIQNISQYNENNSSNDLEKTEIIDFKEFDETSINNVHKILNRDFSKTSRIKLKYKNYIFFL